MDGDNWGHPTVQPMAVFLNGCGITEPGLRGEDISDDSFLIMLNPGHEDAMMALPEAVAGQTWELVLDTAANPSTRAQGSRWGLRCASQASTRARSSSSGMSDRPVPTSTYRLQLHAGFGFADAAAIVPYLWQLGVSHLYLSPVLQAVPGSMHGYDVVDHSRVSTDLGGERALVDLADQAHERGLGIVVDVVPNHMAIPAPQHLNRQLWETLRLGRDSSTAHWFDVDWAFGEGKLALPMLGESLDEVLQAGAITFGEHEGEQVLRYGDHVFPLAPGTASDDVRATLAGQHYQLAGWREKSQILNYRRFFDVDTLIAIRVELDDVFDATHATLLDLHRPRRHRRLPDRPPGRLGRPAGLPGAPARPAPEVRGSWSRRSSSLASGFPPRGRAQVRRATTPSGPFKVPSSPPSGQSSTPGGRLLAESRRTSAQN